MIVTVSGSCLNGYNYIQESVEGICLLAQDKIKLRVVKGLSAAAEREIRRKMGMEISKSDWKLYREKIADWQENYMDRLNKEYIALLSSDDGNPSDRFWKLEERIKKDRRHPGVTIEMTKSSALFDIANLIRLKVIIYEDLAEFSDQLREAVKIILDR